MDYTLLIVLLCLAIGFAVGVYWIRLKGKSRIDGLQAEVRARDLLVEKQEGRNQILEQEREALRQEKENLSVELARNKADFDNLKERSEEQKEEFEKLQQKFQKEFENLANKIFDDKSEKFTARNKENISNILKPLQEKIQHFEKRVEETNKESIDRGAQLRQQIIGLKELNEKITREAHNLTKALKGDTKMQGNWGEVVLESVLERSGLRKDNEYFVQQSFTTDEGRRVLPDVVIHLPGDKRLVIDSKVSLNAYERYVNEPDEATRQPHLKNHVLAIRNHVKTLGEKSYHTLYQMQSPDFVLLFIPIEPAFATASMEYPSLYSEAFEKNVIIVTPTTLLAVLKTIDSMWQNEKQQQNAIEIATQAGNLYDAFVNLTDELIKVGKQISTVQSSYEGAMKKLTGRGNLIRRVERLRELGAKAGKHINQKLLDRANEEEDD